MKTIILISFVLLLRLSTGSVEAQIPAKRFSVSISDHWLKGNKVAVMKLAQTRLEQNPGDLASLLILLEYASTFMDTATLKELIPVIRKSGSNVTTQNFTKAKPLFASTLDSIDSILPLITDEMREAEAYKGSLPDKPLSVLPIIESLENDHLVTPLSLYEENQLTEASVINQERGVPNSDQIQRLSLSEVMNRYPSPKASVISLSHLQNDDTHPQVVIVVLMVAAIGLLWLLAKKRK